MKNKQKQSREEPTNPKQQIQPTAKNLPEAELDKVAGGLNYGTIEWSYTKQKSADAQKGSVASKSEIGKPED